MKKFYEITEDEYRFIKALRFKAQQYLDAAQTKVLPEQREIALKALQIAQIEHLRKQLKI